MQLPKLRANNSPLVEFSSEFRYQLQKPLMSLVMQAFMVHLKGRSVVAVGAGAGAGAGAVANLLTVSVCVFVMVMQRDYRIVMCVFIRS